MSTNSGSRPPSTSSLSLSVSPSESTLSGSVPRSASSSSFRPSASESTGAEGPFASSGSQPARTASVKAVEMRNMCILQGVVGWQRLAIPGGLSPVLRKPRRADPSGRCSRRLYPPGGQTSRGCLESDLQGLARRHRAFEIHEDRDAPFRRRRIPPELGGKLLGRGPHGADRGLHHLARRADDPGDSPGLHAADRRGGKVGQRLVRRLGHDANDGFAGSDDVPGAAVDRDDLARDAARQIELSDAALELLESPFGSDELPFVRRRAVGVPRFGALCRCRRDVESALFFRQPLDQDGAVALEVFDLPRRTRALCDERLELREACVVALLQRAILLERDAELRFGRVAPTPSPARIGARRARRRSGAAPVQRGAPRRPRRARARVVPCRASRRALPTRRDRGARPRPRGSVPSRARSRPARARSPPPAPRSIACARGPTRSR